MANVSVPVVRVLKDIAPLFYVVPPSESSFEQVEEVPDYTKQVIPYFVVFVAVEAVVRWLQSMPLTRTNDSVNSMTAGLLMTLGRLICGSFEIASYAWIHTRFRLLALPWDSTWTWCIAMLTVDFAYYWFHRMAHEVNLFWAAHQVHHSSEDYAFPTALRQSALQRFTSWFFYLPLALFLPPSAYFVHKQFNLLYQFWIHTEVIDRLGPLEWVLNTPSHHRVHHGRNPYCIDKNYAGVLIIWDRMFGTFEPERREEKVIYGLVHPLASWNPLWAQVHHLRYLWYRFWEMEGAWHKVCLLLKGPGWSPGKPRLGCIEDIPQVSPDEKRYDHPVPFWMNVYVIIHFNLVLYASVELGARKNSLPFLLLLLLILFFTVTLTNFGFMFEHKPICVKIEVLRLALLLLADFLLVQSAVPTGLSSVVLAVFRLSTLFSVALWGAIWARQALGHSKED